MPLPGQPLGQFIQQALLALVFSPPRLVHVPLHQLAQSLDPGIRLLPGTTGILQIVLVPGQALPLLGHGRFKLPQKALVVDQPAAIDALATAVDPLRLVTLTKRLELSQLGLGLSHQLLKVPQPLGCLAFGLLGHLHHWRQAQKFKQLWSRLSQSRDLISVGAYVAGGDPETDLAIALQPKLVDFLRQP